MVEFFQTNRDVVYFVYGQAFFVLGLAIALQSRKHSQLALAKHLWLLAVFGIVHGIYEWGAVFIPIQKTYLLPDAVNVLRLAQLALEAISFLALFQFGMEMSITGSDCRRTWRAVPLVMVVVWGGAFFILQALFGDTFQESWNIGDSLLRYLLGVPSAATAAWGLWRQAQQVSRMDLPRIANHLRGAAAAFAVYTGTSVIVPRGDFFPASVLNYDVFIQVVGIPVAVFRALCGVLIAYLIIRGLEIFNVETDRQLEDAVRGRAVAIDRERIGRELHDGIIQSLYAVGLTLEDAALTIQEDTSSAKNKIGAVIGALNRTIRDIRSYILDLRRPGDSGDWQNDLGEMTRAFRLQTLVDAEFQVEGQPRAQPSDEAKKQIVAIAREALVNIGRHARATHVTIKLIYRPDHVELEIADNGVGFSIQDRDAAERVGAQQGLRNMRERAHLIGAQWVIESAPQQGTHVRLTLPNPKE